MADDETIVIRVNAAQGEAALRALGQAGVEASTGVESLGTAAAKSEVHLKDLTRNIGAGISLMSILRENLDALKPALEGLGEGIKFAATQAGASNETVTNLGRALDSLIHPSHIAANAIESLQVAWLKFQEEVVGSSTVIPHNVKTIEESLSALAAARKNAATQQAEGLAAEQQSLDETAKAEAALEAAAVKSAEERAKAEAKAAADVVEALAKQEEAFNKMLADTANYVAERDKILNAPNKGFDGSPDKSGAAKSLAGLKEQIKEIQDSTLVSPEQANQLQDLRRQAIEAARAVSDLEQSYTLANMNGEELAQKQNAAWEKYYALRHANDAIVQRNVDADLRALWDQNEAVAELADSADSAAGSFGDLADAAGSLGDESKKGAEKGKEGLDKLNDGFNEAIPLATQLRDLMQEIVTLGSQADI
jgi:hypothetical protein